jgi:subtilisin family serine protease
MKTKLYLPVFFLLVFSNPSKAQTVYTDFVDGVVYFKVYDTSSVSINYSNPSPEIAAVISNYSVTSISVPFRLPDFSMQKIYKATFSNINSVNSLISDLAAIPYIEYAEKSPLYALNYIPNDYNGTIQWGLQKINATSAWGVTTGSSSVKIAIVDNAVNYLHQDILANAWTNPGEIPNNGLDDDLNGYTDDIHGYDLADGDNNPTPPPGTLNTSAFVHGTHCAGIASAVSDNAIGISSIGFRAKIISVKCAADNSSVSSLTNAYEGVDYAMSAGAKIVSMSFGSTATTITWQYIISAAQTRGIMLVASAGNDNSSTPTYPAAYAYVIAVGSTNSNDNISYFSNYGSWVDVMAPGEGIYSTLIENGNTYGYLSGTSMACPLVAGLASLVYSQNLNYSESQVESLIKNGCDNIDALNPNYVGQMGSGRINAFHAISPLGITSLSQAQTIFSVYPNPSNGNFFLQPVENVNESISMIVYDVQGNEVANEMLNNLSTDEKITIQFKDFLKPGIYFIKFYRNEAEFQSVKILILNSQE